VATGIRNSFPSVGKILCYKGTKEIKKEMSEHK